MPLDPERERELRQLAARLLVSRRHRRAGRALLDALEELDWTRDRLWSVAGELAELQVQRREQGGELY